VREYCKFGWCGVVVVGGGGGGFCGKRDLVLAAVGGQRTKRRRVDKENCRFWEGSPGQSGCEQRQRRPVSQKRGRRRLNANERVKKCARHRLMWFMTKTRMLANLRKEDRTLLSRKIRSIGTPSCLPINPGDHHSRENAARVELNEGDWWGGGREKE